MTKRTWYLDLERYRCEAVVDWYLIDLPLSVICHCSGTQYCPVQVTLSHAREMAHMQRPFCKGITVRPFVLDSEFGSSTDGKLAEVMVLSMSSLTVLCRT